MIEETDYDEVPPPAPRPPMVRHTSIKVLLTSLGSISWFGIGTTRCEYNIFSWKLGGRGLHGTTKGIQTNWYIKSCLWRSHVVGLSDLLDNSLILIWSRSIIHVECDWCVYVRMFDDGSYIFLLLYVDDMLISAKSICKVDGLKFLLHKEFNMKDLGTAKNILGRNICRDREAWKLWLS